LRTRLNRVTGLAVAALAAQPVAEELQKVRKLLNIVCTLHRLHPAGRIAG
jgi:hypothetical protein